MTDERSDVLFKYGSAVGELNLRYEPDLGYGGVLHAEVKAGGYGGFTSYHAPAEEVMPFVNNLSAFPLRVANLAIGLELEGGPIISINIAPSDSTGRFNVCVKLAYDGDRQIHVSTKFVTTYSNLQEFGRFLKQAMSAGGSATVRSAQ